jgi:hypothetical protein
MVWKLQTLAQKREFSVNDAQSLMYFPDRNRQELLAPHALNQGSISDMANILQRYVIGCTAIGMVDRDEGVVAMSKCQVLICLR